MDGRVAEHHTEHRRKVSDKPLIALTAAERSDMSDNKDTSTSRIFSEVLPLVYDWTSIPADLTTVKEGGLIKRTLLPLKQVVTCIQDEEVKYLKSRETDIVAFGKHAQNFAAGIGLNVAKLTHPCRWNITDERNKAWKIISELHFNRGLPFFETEDDFSKAVKAALLIRCPESGKSLRRCRGQNTLGPKGRSDVCRKRAKTLGSQSLSAIASRSNAARTAETRSECGRKRAATLGESGLLQSQRNRIATMGIEGLERAATTQRDTKRAKWELSYIEKNGEPQTEDEKIAFAAAIAERDAKALAQRTNRAKRAVGAASSSNA